MEVPRSAANSSTTSSSSASSSTTSSTSGSMYGLPSFLNIKSQTSTSASNTSGSSLKVPSFAKLASSAPLAKAALASSFGQGKRGGQELGGLEGAKRIKPEDKARVEHERLVAGKNKRIAELVRSLEEREREVEELRGRVGRQERLVAEVEERVRCPVCLDVPTTSPVYSCPRGHLVCSPCSLGISATCPMCRTKMTKAVSLLAATVIEHLEHRCKFKGCEARLPLADMAAHRAVCEQRAVPCPATACRRTVAAAEVVQHILHTCTSSFATASHAPHNVAEEMKGLAGRYVQRYISSSPPTPPPTPQPANILLLSSSSPPPLLLFPLLSSQVHL